jgi:thiol:disulfide interchange protein DsbD
MRKLLYLLLPIFFIISTFGWSASNIVKFKTSVSKAQVKANEKFAVKVNITIDPTHYTYSFQEQIGPDGIGPTRSEISVEPTSLAKISGKIQYPTTKSKYDEGFLMDIKYYKGSFAIEIPLEAKKDIDFSKDKLELVFVFQFCDSVSCLPPDFYKAIVTPTIYTSKFVELLQQNTEETAIDSSSITPNVNQLENNDKLQQAEATAAPVISKSQSEIEAKKDEGIMSFIWFAMSAGALALLTPCVFPMVPITVSFFTKRAEKEGGKAWRDSFTYAFGIIFTFTALGFLLAILFGATGIRDFAANGWVNLFIAAIFVVFAFNLFGAFEIQLPTGFLNFLNTKSGQSSGFISVLLMSLTFSLTSFTCTVPFVGSALISASGGEWFYPIIGMLAFSAVFAAPFFLLALFPSFLKKMPRGGGWMNNVKVVMGFLEIAASMKFISNADLVWAWGILPKDLFIAIWMGISLLVGFYLIGIFRFPHDTEVETVGSSRAMISLLFFSIGFYLLVGLFGKPLGELDAFLPPSEYNEIMGASVGGAISTGIANSTSKSESNEALWLDNYEAAKIKAKESGKNIFIDFTGFTCTNCRWMEQNFFKRKEVLEALDNYVLVRLYTDRLVEPYISNKKIQEIQFGSIELPLYVIITPEGKLIQTETFTRDFEEFLKFVKLGFKNNS